MTDKRRLNAEAARWLKENAPADLQVDRLTNETALRYTGIGEKGEDIDPRDLVDNDRGKRRRGHEDTAPNELAPVQDVV